MEKQKLFNKLYKIKQENTIIEIVNVVTIFEHILPYLNSSMLCVIFNCNSEMFLKCFESYSVLGLICVSDKNNDHIDILTNKSLLFKEKCDFGFIEIPYEKNHSKETKWIDLALKTTKNVALVVKSNEIKNLSLKYTFKILGKLEMKIDKSLKYQKSQVKDEYNIILIKGE
ncbi:hypothetical protein EHP00_1049 [Ecytonucleospora hepatopenaei]|uniref:Uncharacterized protein n=1 Tax=Ecytonucleospora hepatopenaei TaxID=646526 RepID=A0A1W0E5J4_9MICR|nr:hypothetical protein EHP00_1049 [Ecytonucleospora hepatopenaei]